MITFRTIETRQALREASAFLQTGVDAIHAKGMSQSTCFGDVYMGIAAGGMICTLIYDDAMLAGFYISEKHTEHNGTQSLYLAYVYVGPVSDDITPDVVASFEAQAKALQCSRINFKTVRPGWQRRLKPYGYNPSAIELSKPIE